MPFDFSDRDGAQFLWNKWGAATAAIIDPGTFACVSTLAEEIAGADWRIVDGAGATLSDRDSVNTSEPVARMFHDVSEREDGVSPFYIHSLMLYTTGEAYWHMRADKSGRVIQLDWLNALSTDPNYPRGVIDSFTYSGPDKYMTLPPASVLYERMRNNLLSDFHGFSPIMAAIGANRIQIIQAAGKAALSYFQNDGMPYATFSPTADQKEWDERKVNWIRKSLATGKSSMGKYRTMIFPFPFDGKIFEQPDVKQWADLLRAIEPDIYKAFRVPPQIVGDATTPYQNDEENRKNYHATIRARLKALAAFVNTNLIRRVYGRGSGVAFEFELSPYEHIDAQEREAARDLYDRGLVEGNELRVAYGWSEVDWLKGRRLDPAGQTLVTTELPEAAPAAALAAGTPGDTDKDRGAGSFCVALDIGAQPDLIGLQARVKALAAESGAPFEASAPESFHVTLVYVPDADETTQAAMLEAVKGIPVPDLTLPVGSLRAFDTVGKYALHFRIRANSALRDYQSQIAEALTDAGGRLSAFSDPSRYIPHVTMGYASAAVKSTFQTSLTVKASGVIVWCGDETVFRSAGQPADMITSVEPTSTGAAIKAADEFEAFVKFHVHRKSATKAFAWLAIEDSEGALIASDLAHPDLTQAKAATGQWRRAMQARAGVTDYATKSADDLPEPTREYIKALAEFGYDAPTVRAAGAEHYARLTSIKALSSVRSKFLNAAARLFQAAVSERFTRSRFKADFRVTLFRYARLAMLEGYAEGGIENHELDESDERWLIGFNDEQAQFIDKVAGELYADDVLTDAEVRGKPDMWWNLSVVGAYNEGVMRASKDGVGVFYRGATSDSCPDCKALHLQARRFSVWRKLLGPTLVPSKATECGGFNCGCEVAPRQTAVSRGPLPRLRGYRKAVTEGIDLEVYSHV